MQWGGPILVGFLAAVSIVVGARLALAPSQEAEQGDGLTRVFAFGTGAFFTAVCLDFLPDAWSSQATSTPLWIFLGAFALWAATHLSDGLFSREQEQQFESAASEFTARREGEVSMNQPQPPASSQPRYAQLRFSPVSAIVLAAALSFHTFLEGTAVSLVFRHVNWPTLAFSLAMILHKLPEGVLWGIALSAAFPRDRTNIRRILIIPAACTIVGVFLGALIAKNGSSGAVGVPIAFVAGAMVYIAFSELLPTLRDSNRPGLTQRWFIFGALVMFLFNSLSTVFGS